MNRTVTVKDALELTPAELKSCRAMSYKSGGSLCYWLDIVQYGRATAKVVLVREDDLIVGWCMRMDKSREVGFWTRTTHRKRGIGTLMVQEVSKLGSIKTEPHDYKSAKLFAKTGVLPKGNVRWWKKFVQNHEQYQQQMKKRTAA